MANHYLEIARHVLMLERRPLPAKRIVEIAILRNLMPRHLYGETPHKTLHARLSVDIIRHPDTTPFFRTGAGMFFLKEFKEDPEIPADFKGNYIALRRTKELRREAVLVVKAPSENHNIDELSPIEWLEAALKNGMYSYKKWRAIEHSGQELPVQSFVIVRDGCRLLSYRYGRLSNSLNALSGKKSVGFGGAVTERDNDLLYNSLVGIIENAIAELIYSIGLPTELARKARYEDQIRPRACLRMSSSDEVTSRLYAILDFQCPPGFAPEERNMGLTSFTWLTPQNLPNDLSAFDPVSQNILAHYTYDPDFTFQYDA